MTYRRWYLLVVLGAILTATPGTAGAVEIDLLTQAHLRIDGADWQDQAGGAIANAGDVNGDGRDDIVIGAHLADHNDRVESGSAYVVYGARHQNTLDLAELSNARGFRIDGAAAYDRTGVAVAGAGDVNGDGRDDVIVGAPFAPAQGRSYAGSSYVVYGAAGQGTLDLATGLTTARGFRIDGAATNDEGGAVAGAGDVNADGRDDIIVGALGADNNGRALSGSSYVIYGASSQGSLDLATGLSAARGFRIDGADTGEMSGYSVGGAGDVNGDGRDDVVIGAHHADSNGRVDSGSAYVVYGAAGAANLDLATGLSPARGFRVDGASGGDEAGNWVDGAGDVNGDGRDDVVIAAGRADHNGRDTSGSVYVVYGAATQAALDLATGPSAARGFRIDGAAAQDYISHGSAAGDLNGDGRDDVIVSAPSADNNGRNLSGSAYVVYGAAQQGVLDLEALTAGRGFRIDGAGASDGNYGMPVAGGGDFDGDGRAEVLVGVPGARQSRPASFGYGLRGVGGLPAASGIPRDDRCGDRPGSGRRPDRAGRLPVGDADHRARAAGGPELQHEDGPHRRDADRSRRDGSRCHGQRPDAG